MSGQEERGRSEDEAGWIERARRGDAGAFRHLVDRHAGRVYGLAYRVIGSAPEAEEAAQDAFLRAWRALPEFRGEARFSTWLHRIAVRCAYDASARLRARHARERSLEALVDAPGGEAAVSAAAVRAAPATGGPAAGAATQVTEALLERLPDAQRAVVTLYYLEDRSVDEVARILGLPANTVKTHLHRARAALRTALLREELRTAEATR
jgi:RNA polymerase sigma-70 factor (ECF subfamily)